MLVTSQLDNLIHESLSQGLYPILIFISTRGRENSGIQKRGGIAATFDYELLEDVYLSYSQWL
jgi:hypothetical protein